MPLDDAAIQAEAARLRRVLTDLWPLVAAGAGSLLSLSLPVFEGSPRWARIISVVGGFLVSVFLGPAVVEGVVHAAPWLAHADGAIWFLIALLSMAILAPLAGWLRKAASDPVATFGPLFNGAASGLGSTVTALFGRRVPPSPPPPPVNPGA